MAITEDSVYSGAYEPNYAQPIGFYFNSVAVTNAAETIVDDAMDANADTLCSITAGVNATSITERFEFIFFIDGTQIMATSVHSAHEVEPPTIELIIPAGKNLKITGDNQSSGTSTEVSAYVLIKPLAGTSAT